MTTNAISAGNWPPHTSKSLPWKQTYRGGTIEDRRFRKVVVSLPPFIASTDFWCSPALTSEMEQSLREISALDSSHGQHLRALETLLLRTESVASSKIEAVEADIDDYARALHGIRANESAVSMVAATEALTALIHSVDGGRDVDLGSILRAHTALMKDDPNGRAYAGRVRDMQNWIGGSNDSPRGARYVPPPPETVDSYLADLVAFTNRTDIPVLAQAAIAHAQFESIHPFTDGNGRIGRALINTVLRRRGATHGVVVPLASALVARKEAYFGVLGDYRLGRPEPIIAAFASASGIAAAESRVSANRIAQFPQQWLADLGGIRRGSAAQRLLELLTAQPVFSAEEAENSLGGATSSVYGAIERLRNAGIVRPLTARKRNQVWGVVDMLDELNDLGVRIAGAASGS
jgi:Fic family protein